MSDRCRICHRILKQPEALALGMGSVCAKKCGYKRPRKLRKPRVTALFDLKAQCLGVPLFPLEVIDGQA
ncbi:DUF6011 domain-containing protein [Mesoterricola silvestris]|uniref:Uncharacterized protein n=1 Tax=Mesoterricola silvestris TaxID=2927979 RepID=A0AA48GMQ6_9BACT|nr:hypothetical protein METEAL_15290 [Mesoterricola silvestris]